MDGLKPNEEIMTSAATAAGVLAVFALQAPNTADVRGARPHNNTVHNSVRTAALTATILVAGLSILAKSATIAVVGGLTIAVEGWVAFHANAVDPMTGQVTAPAQFAQPVQPGSGGTGPA
jgi:hypothetical protein